jgi:hypothetical protein
LEAFNKAIENANVSATTTATSADVIKGLAMFRNETLGGMAPNIILTDGTTPNPRQKCMWLYQWKATTYSLLHAEGPQRPTLTPEPLHEPQPGAVSVE